MRYLKENRPPVLIVLALPLPLLNNFRPLRWIRAQPEFRDVPLFVLSGVKIEREDVTTWSL